MGTRTYSRRGADGIRRPTKLGISTGKFTAPVDESFMVREETTLIPDTNMTMPVFSKGMPLNAWAAQVNDTISNAVTLLRTDVFNFYNGKRNADISLQLRQQIEDLHSQLRTQILALSDEEQRELLKSPELNDDMLLIIAQYGNPELREEAARMAIPADLPFKDTEDPLSQTPNTRFQKTPHPNTIYSSLSGIIWGRINTLYPQTETDYYAVNQMITWASFEGYERANRLRGAIKSDDDLVREFFELHALGTMSPIQAAWQATMAEVGPNRDVPRERVKLEFSNLKGVDFKPNPRYVKLLQDEYERVQAELAKRGITEVTLHRGTRYDLGLPLEPWTTSKSVANKFAKRIGNGRGKMYEKTIPAKYFLGHYKITRGWPEKEVLGKKEHMVAGLALEYDATK